MSTLIPVASLEAFHSPFQNDVWSCGVVSQAMVQDAIDHGHALDHDAWATLRVPGNQNLPSQEQHAARIAYLVQHGWTDSISIDVGIPSMGYQPDWPYLDGNHRICAAIIRGDSHIEAEVSGDVDYGEELFGVSILDEQEGEAA